MEDWRTVPGFDDYEVSSLGMVRRVSPDLRNHKVTGECLKWFVSPSGYASVSLCRDSSKHGRRINRLVCEAFKGPPPSKKHHAAHGDGDRLNNAAENLRWATPVQNEKDKRAHGTAAIGDRHWSVLYPEKRAKGDDHGLAKLTAEAIPYIRADPRAAHVIAKQYGVHKDTINNVRSGRTWRHV